MKPINYDTPEHEHELEPQVGLPEPLPSNERLLWQGSPDWRGLARHSFHLRGLTLYFALILALRGGFVLSGGGGLREASWAVLMLLPLVVLALGVLATLAWLTARTTVYTVTDRRVVMRIGIVLSLTLNLPFRHITAAGLALQRDGSGHIPLTLAAGEKIAYVHLWPHARPWRLAQPQPMLLCLKDATRVGALLTQAWQQACGAAAPTAYPVSAPAAERARGHATLPQLAPH